MKPFIKIKFSVHIFAYVINKGLQIHPGITHYSCEFVVFKWPVITALSQNLISV